MRKLNYPNSFKQVLKMFSFRFNKNFNTPAFIYMYKSVKYSDTITWVIKFK